MDKMQLIDDVLNSMAPILDEDKLRHLESTLLIKMHGLEIIQEHTELTVSDRSWEWYLFKFCADKRIENCAESTLRSYCRFLRKMYGTVQKPLEQITAEDLRYLHCLISVPQRERTAAFSFLHERYASLFQQFFQLGLRNGVHQEGSIQRDP